MQSQVEVSSSRSIAIIGLFSALYIVTSALTSFVTQLGYPEHFLRGILMTAVILRTGRKWSATFMGIACGLVFALVVPAPAPYLLPSTIVSGVVFDLALIFGAKYGESSKSQTRLLIGAGLSGLGESIVALAILTAFAPSALVNTSGTIAVAWAADLVLNVILSVAGAFLAFRYLSRKPLPRQTELTS